MDKSQDYIRMCAAAKEIQEFSHFEEGDYSAMMGCKEPIVRLNKGLTTKSDVWLPTQDQLQHLFRKDDPIEMNRSPVILINNIFAYMRAADSMSLKEGYTGYRPTTMEQWWLCLVMRDLHKKRYDSVNKQWI
jgi:hypothetical protein